MQSFEAGRKADVTCACHWTINVAASKGLGRMSSEVYSVAPAGIFVQPDSKIKTPEDLAGVPISVGYQSGSHYATIQALEQFIPQDKMNLVYADGMLFARMDKLLDGSAPAVHLFSGPYYFAEQLGYRKILDATFMIGMMIHGDPDPEDLRKFYRALRRAQRDLDLRPELYTHYYKNEFPERYHARMDTRRWGPGERLVFEPYTQGGLRGGPRAGSPRTASSRTAIWAASTTRRPPFRSCELRWFDAQSMGRRPPKRPANPAPGYREPLKCRAAKR